MLRSDAIPAGAAMPASGEDDGLLRLLRATAVAQGAVRSEEGSGTMTWWKNPAAGGPDGKSIALQVQEWIDASPADDGGREFGWHVSSLAHLCPRAEALKRVIGDRLPKEKVFDAKSLVRFDVGTSVHWWWQNCYLGPMGLLIGKWACTGMCGEFVEGRMPQEKHGCGVKYGRGAGRVFWEYLEPQCHHQSPEWSRPIVGRCDGEIEQPEPPRGATGTRGVLELKTANAETFPRQQVDPDYEFQVQCYMWLRGRRWAKIVYINPDGLFRPQDEPGLKLSCQEFHLAYEDRFREAAIKKVDAAEKAIREFVAILRGRGEFAAWPDRICETKRCRTAERCPVAALCFDDVLMSRIGLRLAAGRDPVEGLLA